MSGTRSDQEFSDRAVSELLIRVFGWSESVAWSVKNYMDAAKELVSLFGNDAHLHCIARLPSAHFPESNPNTSLK